MTRKTKLPDPYPSGRDSERGVHETARPRDINRLSRDLGVPPNRIHGLVHGTRSITADTALRLGIFFGVAPETWLNLQTEYDLRVVRRNFGEEIARAVRKRDAA